MTFVGFENAETGQTHPASSFRRRWHCVDCYKASRVLLSIIHGDNGFYSEVGDQASWQKGELVQGDRFFVTKLVLRRMRPQG
jgi:hypothetical protein